MTTYAILLRGINVGGRNKVPMAGLRTLLEEVGFSDVSTYLNSGNAIVSSGKGAKEVQSQIEEAISREFAVDGKLIKVLALTRRQLQAVVDNRPGGFGDEPSRYYSDAIFLIGITAAKAMTAFNPREGVDTIWPGRGVIYFQRLSAERTRSRLGSMMASPLYESMTIRSWSTTTKLLALMND